MNFLALFLLVVAFVLSALSYYKLNPERVVVSVPFAFMVIPLVLFVVFLVISAGAIPVRWSEIALLVALAVLAAALFQARCLLPQKPNAGGG